MRFLYVSARAATLTTAINRHISAFGAAFSLSTFRFACLQGFGAAPHCPSLWWGSLLLAWKKPGLLTRGAGAEITSRLCRASGSGDMKAGQWSPPRGTLGQGRVSGRLMLLLCCPRAGALLTGAGTGEKVRQIKQEISINEQNKLMLFTL